MKITKEEKEKRAKAERERKDFWDKQIIEIAPGWKIIRADNYNWAIPASKERSGGSNLWYYGKLIHALEAVAHGMLHDGPKTSLADIQSQMSEIKEILRQKVLSLPEIYSGNVARIP